MWSYIAVAGLISLIAVWLTMPGFIKYLQSLSFKQTVSEYALADDQKKAGTPIMGGVLFIMVPILVTFIIGLFLPVSRQTWMCMLAFFGYGLIGFIDDYLISVKKNNDGLKPAQKFGLQILLAVIFFILYRSNCDLDLILPFGRRIHLSQAVYFILILLMFSGASNAVNLTDGMDGLAAGVSFLALIPFFAFALKDNRPDLGVLLISVMGALIGYLRYNMKPARVFMGDTGALALGGLLAAVAMVLKKELLLILIAGVPVVETLCVIIQQVAVRTVHKRVFSYTPIHYAFRLKGYDEKNIVYGFWAVGAVLAILGLWIGWK